MFVYSFFLSVGFCCKETITDVIVTCAVRNGYDLKARIPTLAGAKPCRLQRPVEVYFLNRPDLARRNGLHGIPILHRTAALHHTCTAFCTAPHRIRCTAVWRMHRGLEDAPPAPDT